MPIRSLALILVAVSFGAASARADDSLERSLSPYFVVRGAAPGQEPFALESTSVRASVEGVIADVVVTQRYRNRGSTPIHARYVFPASTRAAVHGMTFQVGARRVVARIREREQARREFEAAQASGRSASLLEQERPNVFAMSVANILPGDSVEVELRYTELLVPTDGRYAFVYPTVVGPRYTRGEGQAEQGSGTPYLRAGVAPDTRFDLEVALATGVPIADVRSPSHRISVERSDPARARVRLESDGRFPAGRDFVLDYALRGATMQTGLLLQDGPDENHFLLMVEPPARVAPADIPPREYLFVVDVSGSMAGFPLETSKALLRDLVGHLRSTDRFDVLLFAGDSRLFAERSVAATRANVDAAIAFLDAEEGGGGTELAAALERVDEVPRAPDVARSVVVITDGYIAAEEEAFERVVRWVGSTNVFAFGIGSSVNRSLVEGLARSGRGEPFVVLDPSQATAIASRFRRYIEAPVLTAVHVAFEGFEAFDVEPERQPDLFAERPIVVTGKWRGGARGEIVVTGRTPSGPFESRIPVTSGGVRDDLAALPRLWARSRIASLSDANLFGESEANTRTITQLGLRHSLLTPYTSFVAVLETVRNPGGQGSTSNVPSALPDGVSESAIAGEMTTADEPEMLALLALLVAILAVIRRTESVRSEAA